MPDREIILNILDLLETMDQGINYIEIKLEELKIEETKIILSDIIGAFSAIESANNTILDKIEENEIEKYTDILRGKLDRLVKEYEKNNGKKSYEIVKSSVEPAFKNWKREIEVRLRPFIVS